MKTKHIAAITVITAMLSVTLCPDAQCAEAERSNKSERSSVRRGNKEYENKNFVGAEIDYRKALEAAPLSGDATFNLGNALYGQQKFEDAAKEFEKSVNSETDPVKQAEAWYNLGNTHMKNRNFAAGIEAYKNALRKNPKDEDARYNLRLAQLMLREQQQQQQNQDDRREEEQQQQQQQQQPKDEQQQQKEDDRRQQQQSPSQMTRENAQQILDALQQDERNTQEKVRKAIMEQHERRRTDKEW